MSYFQSNPFVNNLLSFYFLRSFVHLVVLASLLVHQFLFKNFIDPYLSISIYSLCAFILLTDGLCLFFYKENKNQLSFHLFLSFFDALFLSSLVVVMGLPGLFFVFLLMLFQTLPDFVFGKIFQPLVFLIYLSILLPITFLWDGKFSYDDRLSLIVFINFILFFTVGFSWLMSCLLKSDRNLKQTSLEQSLTEFYPEVSLVMSLNLIRKLKPVFNSLEKYFPKSEKYRSEELSKKSISSNLFPITKGREQLRQIQNFILKFIEYAEPQTESLSVELIDLKQLIKKLLQKLENHSQRPIDLIQTEEGLIELKVKGSMIHLSKCFEEILINSFEALKNQEKPEIKILMYLEKSWAILEFIDNGHGIDTSDMKRIFDPLFSKRFGLKGLGLSYVQKIVKAHQAAIEIKSSKSGTIVSLKFPIDYAVYDNFLFKGKSKSRKKIA